jgi:YYY domain-containing protein
MEHEAHTRKKGRTRWQALWLSHGLLLLILLVGGYFRTLNLFSWDGGTGQHPDERFFADVTSLVRVPASVSDYFDSAHSPGNPRNIGKDYFTYGTFPPLLTRFVAVMLTPPEQLPETLPTIGSVEQQPNHEREIPRFPEPIRTLLNPDGENMTVYANAYRVGRSLSVLFDLGTIVLAYLIGARLFGRRVGLLSAALLALAVFHIQQAHFYQDPTFSTFFATLALYWAVRAAQGGGFLSFALLGLSIGAAAGNRITLVTLAITAIVAAVLTSVAHREKLIQKGKKRIPALLDLLAWRGMPLLVLAGICTILGFRIVQPYAFIGSTTPDAPPLPGQQVSVLDFMEGWGFFDMRPDPRYVENMERIKRYTTGENDWPPALQWVNRTDYLFPLENVILWGMGIPAGVAAWLGWLVAGIGFFRLAMSGGRAALWRKPVLAALVLWVWIAAYFGWMGGQFTLYLRYMLPISVPLVVFAAWLLAGPRQSAPLPSGSSLQAQAEEPEKRKGRALQKPDWPTLLARFALVVVILGTFAWAYAFTRIYTREHSRITAARWLLQHAPAGATITHESWDDPLPLHVDPARQRQKGFHSITTHLYAEDEPAKYYGRGSEPGLLQNLEAADYITLTSNRVYDAVRRSPMRHPASMRYYHYLFSGDLGFELVADITSYPTLFKFPIPDQGAEEAFSVYDHPRVLIFRKTPLFSRERAEHLITGDMMWDEVYKLPVFPANLAPTALRLTESEWPEYASGGTWSEVFNRRSIVNGLAPLVWLAVLELVGLATFALLFRLLPWLPDRGFSLARGLGLLVVACGAWLLGSGGILSFSPQSVWLCAAPLLVGGAWVAWRSRAALLAFVRERRTALLTAQGIYLGAFVLLLLIRWLNPDLWHPSRGGEKMMEMAYLNAIIQSAEFPPYDPWFAGGYINYYYFGFVIVGTLIHLTTIIPSIAFNLAVPTIFALTALGAWGVAYNLLAPKRAAPSHTPTSIHPISRINQALSSPATRAYLAALLAPVLVLLTGNLAQPLWFLNGYAADQTHRPEWVYWDATRIVEHTVNEFPFFTFLFADMHPHMIVMPFSLLVLGLCVALARMGMGIGAGHHRRSEARDPPEGGRFAALLRGLFVFPRWSYVAILLLLGLLAGALQATNTWDYPTFVGLTLVTLVLIHYHSIRKQIRSHDIRGDTLPVGPSPPALSPIGRGDGAHSPGGEPGMPVALMITRHLFSLVISAVLVVFVGRLLFLPFTSHFATESSGVDLLPESMVRTTAGELLRLHGLWLFLVTSAGGFVAYRWLRFQVWHFAAIGLVVGAFIFTGVFYDYTSAPLILVPLLGGAGVLLWLSRNLPPRVLLPMLWASMALAILLGVEIVVVRGDVSRMNTVFKFGLHAWILLALTSAIALPWMVWEGRRRIGQMAGLFLRSLHWVWRGAAVVLVLAAFVYPLTATPGRIADRFRDNLPHTLDGLEFMKYVTHREREQEFPLFEDYEAIRWLQHHVSGTPILLEAHDFQYHWAGRIATYTGLPTIIGWEWHQIQQRMVARADHVVRSRGENVIEMYDTPDAERAMQLIKDYGIEYIYVGGVERAYYSEEGLAKFDALTEQGELERVFETGATAIYRVVHPGEPQILTTDISVEPPHLDMPPPLRLMDDVNELPAVNEFAWNEWVGDYSGRAVLVWLVALYGLMALGLPLAVLVFGHWRDGGFVWARLIGLLVVGYAVWLPASLDLWSYSREGVIGGIVLVLLLNLAITRRAGGVRAIGARLWQARRHILIGELLFLVGFGAFVGLRALNPDLWHPVWGGEKPMEFGFLNAILRSPVMPPYDPFYSDGYINYYYYGLYLVSLPIKATGIHPAVAFNLVIPTLFAFTLTGAYAIVLRLTGLMRYGLLGGVLVAVAGNLASFFEVGWSQGIGPVLNVLFGSVHNLSFWERLAALGPRLGDWYIGPSRVITEPSFTINEFPFWSFLFSDLHPHLIALPITLLSIALAYQLLVTGNSTGQRVSLAGRFPLFALVALTLGALAATNSWDFPPHTLLASAVLIGAAWRTKPDPPGTPDPAVRGGFVALLRRVGGAGVLALALAMAALSLYMPFFDHYHAFVSGIGLVRDGTHILDYLVVYGLFVAVLLPLGIGAVVRLLLWMGRTLRRRRIVRYVPAKSEQDNPVLPSLLKNLPLPGFVLLLLNSLLLVLVLPVAPSVVGARLRHLWSRKNAEGESEPHQQKQPTGQMVRRTTIVRSSSCIGQIVSVLGLVLLVGVLLGLTLSTVLLPFVGLQFWLGLLLLLALAVMLSRQTAPSTWFIFLLAAMGYAISLGIEVVFVRDHLAGGEHYRMNTVFKFGMQIWMFLALAAAGGLPLLLRGIHRVGRWAVRVLLPAPTRQQQHKQQRIGGIVAQGVGLFAFAVLLLTGLIFPLVGPASRVANRFPQSPEPTLDGLAFMHLAEFTHEGKRVDLRPDAEAIAWINDNITGTPIMAQSGLWFYRTYGIRVAANTGLPTIVSALHENEQRDPGIVGKRDGDVETLYRTPDREVARQILSRYQVNYVYVGSVERAFYPPEGIRKFQEMQGAFLDVVYQTSGVQIYKVRGVASPYPEPEPYIAGEPLPLPASPSGPSGPSGPSEPEFPADLQALEEMVASDPTNNLNAIELALRYRKLERYEDAIRVLAEAAKHHPNDIFLHHVWGDILAHVGRYDEAKEVFEFAARTSPTSFNWYKVGNELLQWGRLEAAEPFLIKAITTEPVEPAAHFALGKLYYQQEEWEQAEKHLSLYLTLAPDGQFQAEARELLDSL